MPRLRPPTESRLLWALLALAAAIRLAYLLQIAPTDLARVPMLDSRTYHEWAVDLLAGNWGWYEAYWMGPLYPHLLALVYLVTGPDIIAVLALQLLLTVVNVWLVHRLARDLVADPDDGGRSPVPLLAAALYAFYGPAVFYAGLLLMATVVSTLLLVIARLAVRAAGDHRVRTWLVLGALVGLTAQARGNVILLLALLPLLPPRPLPRRARARLAGLLLLGAATVILPVTVRNVVVGKDLVLLTTNGGVNLLIGQQVEHNGLFAHVDDRLQAEFDPSQEQTLEQEVGRDLKGSEVSRVLLRCAWDRFRDDLPRMPMHYLRKAYRFWNGYELPQIEPYGHWRGEILSLRLLPVPFVLLAAAGLPGLRFLPRRARLLLAVLIGGYFVSLLPFFPTARYRLPIVPLLAVPAAALLAALAADRKNLKTWGPVLAGGILVLWPGWTAFDDAEILWQVRLHDASRAALRGDLKAVLAAGREAEQARPGMIDTPYQLGLALQHMKAHAEACAALAVAQARAPDNPLIPYRIGRNLELDGDGDGALDAYARAAELNPDWAYPWLRRGLILRRQGNLDQALADMRRAHELSPGNRRIRANLGSLLAENGATEAARELLAALTKDEPRYVNGWFNLALLEWNAGRPEQARRALQKAAELRNLTEAEQGQVRRLQEIMAAGGA